MKDLLRNVYAVNFIIIVYVVAKLKFFKVSCIDLASMKWRLFGFFWLLFSQILLDLAEILSRSSPIRQMHCFKNPSKFWNLAQIERTESLQVLSILRPNFLAENQKYC